MSAIKTHAVILLLLYSIGVRSEERCRDVVRLRFHSVRDGVPSNTPPLPASAGSTCDPRNVKVTCSDTGYPNDIFCDVGGVKVHSEWLQSTDIVEIQLTYEHPSAEGTFCTARLTPGAGEEYAFAGAECSPAVEDQSLPRFLVSEVKWLKLKTTAAPPTPVASSTTATGVTPTIATGASSTTVTVATSAYDHGDECFFKTFQFGRERIQGRVKGGVKRGRRTTVEFDFLHSYCQSPSTTFVGGRDDNKVVYSYDGRRFRPVLND